MRNHKVYSLRASFLFVMVGLIPIWQNPFPIHQPLGSPNSWNPVFFAPLDYTGCTPQHTPVANSANEQAVIELVNAERAKNGLAPLKRDPQLDEAARYHASDMREDDYFNHDSYDRVNNELAIVCKWSDRVGQFYADWSSLAENIAWGYEDPADVMDGWMDSPGHRANILSPKFSEIGVGLDTDNYWVQDFGKRPSVYPVVINGEAEKTDRREISLYIYGSWSKVRLRNDSEGWSDWVQFQNSMNWILPDQQGQHTVTVEMTDGSQTVTSSDVIELQAGTTNPSYSHLTYLPFLADR